MLMELLDRLDPRRFDAEEIADLLNAFDELSEAEQTAAPNAWEYSGLTAAEHVLSGLLPELHNTTAVVRDLPGEPMLLWTDRDDRWQVGLLHSEHFAGASELEELLESDCIDLDRADPALLLRVIDQLPAAPGPVRSH
jgi:hypothetical protein